MTKEEIIALIDSAIAGQGNQVDAGSVLDKILKGVIGLIVPTGQKYIIAESFDIIPKDIVDKLVAGDVVITGEGDGNSAYVKYADGETTEIAEIAQQGLFVYEYENGEYVNTDRYSWNTQANWNEADSSNPAYIKNKPTIPDAPTIYRKDVSSLSEFATPQMEITFLPKLGDIVEFYLNNSLVYRAQVVSMDNSIAGVYNVYVITGGNDHGTPTLMDLYYQVP